MCGDPTAMSGHARPEGRAKATGSARYADDARHAFGAQFAEVQVDRDTGEVRLRVAQDAAGPDLGSVRAAVED
ncbi:hypothetical protein [Kitasatospora purpeofusca]|uniref:hypothetical protein n=1 Tax=Kitasatospora purpeofusca TaxID=67352 RepID=UPI00368EECCE